MELLLTCLKVKVKLSDFGITAFISQEVGLLNDTLRENFLFGKQPEPERYKEGSELQVFNVIKVF